jgi:hypothetical protein
LDDDPSIRSDAPPVALTIPVVLLLTGSCISSRIRLLPPLSSAMSVMVLLGGALLLPSGGVADAMAAASTAWSATRLPSRQGPVPTATGLR